MKFSKGSLRAMGPNDPPAGTPPVIKTENNDPPPQPAPKTFSQEDLNKQVEARLAAEKAKFNKERQENLERIKALETDATKLPEVEKALEELRNQGLTKEQLAADAAKKQQAAYDAKLKAETEKADRWQLRYSGEKVIRDISDAAGAKEIDAFSAPQIVALLKGDARVADKIDPETGKPTGDLETRIKRTVVKDGKAITLDLTPMEAVKSMKEDPSYGNLFKAGVVGGIGGAAPRTAGAPGSLSNMTQAEINKKYREGGAKALLG